MSSLTKNLSFLNPCAIGSAGNAPSTVTTPPTVANRRRQHSLHPAPQHRACRGVSRSGLFVIGFGVNYSTGFKQIETG